MVIYENCTTNYPASSTSSCTDQLYDPCTHINHNGGGPPHCQRCCINSMLNDHTYSVLKRICRKIIKDFNRQQCREKYTVFDGGNSVNVRIHRSLSSNNPCGENRSAMSVAPSSAGKYIQNMQNKKPYSNPIINQCEENMSTGKRRRGDLSDFDDIDPDVKKSDRYKSSKSKKRPGADDDVDDVDVRSRKRGDKRYEKDDGPQTGKSDKGKSKNRKKGEYDDDETPAGKGDKSKSQNRKKGAQNDEDDDDGKIDKNTSKNRKKGAQNEDDDDAAQIERNKSKNRKKGEDDDAVKVDKNKSKNRKRGAQNEDEDEDNAAARRRSKSKNAVEDAYDSKKRTKQKADIDVDKKRKSKGRKTSIDADDNDSRLAIVQTGKRKIKGSVADIPIITDLRMKVRKGRDVVTAKQKNGSRISLPADAMSKSKKDKQKYGGQSLETYSNRGGRKMSKTGGGKTGPASAATLGAGPTMSRNVSNTRQSRENVYVRRFMKHSRSDEVKPCDFMRANMEQRELCDMSRYSPCNSYMNRQSCRAFQPNPPCPPCLPCLPCRPCLPQYIS